MGQLCETKLYIAECQTDAGFRQCSEKLKGSKDFVMKAISMYMKETWVGFQTLNSIHFHFMHFHFRTK